MSFCRLIFSFFDHRAGGGGARERVSERVCETAARERATDARTDVDDGSGGVVGAAFVM